MNTRFKKPAARIEDLIITPIAITDPPLLNAAGLHAPYALRTIIEVITEDGFSGLSEIPGNEATNKALEQLRPLLRGRDPFQLHLLKDLIDDHFGAETSADRGAAPWDQRKLVHVYSAVEVACLDIMGKITGRPVVDLLGGKRRERVPFAAYLFYKYEGAGGVLGFDTDPDATGWAQARQAAALDPGAVVRQAVVMCNHFGFQSVKLKGGVFEPAEEVAAIKALYEHYGAGVPLRLDPNALWRMETAVKVAEELMPILEYLEDPVRGQDQMAVLRKRVRVPLATNMCTTSFADLPHSLKVHSEDIILSDHHFWGGLRASMQLSTLCGTFGRSLSMHSNSHLGISLAAMVHLGAALPELPYALDTHYPWQSEEVIAGGRMAFEDGAIRVGEAPGLGVELDRNALQELHANYLRCGLKERDDEIEMQKVNPEWQFMQVRW